MEKLFKIKHVARLLNMSSDSIRFYEKKRIVTPLRDTQNAYRGVFGKKISGDCMIVKFCNQWVFQSLKLQRL